MDKIFEIIGGLCLAVGALVVSVVLMDLGPERMDAAELRVLSKSHAVTIMAMSNDLGGPSEAPDDEPEPQGDECGNCYGTGRSGDGIGVCTVCDGTGKRSDRGSLPQGPAKVKCDNPKCDCENCDCEDCDCGVVKKIYMHTMPKAFGNCPPCNQWKRVELPKITPETGWEVEVIEGQGYKGWGYPHFRVYKDTTKTGQWVKGYQTFEQLKAQAK